MNVKILPSQVKTQPNIVLNRELRVGKSRGPNDVRLGNSSVLRLLYLRTKIATEEHVSFPVSHSAPIVLTRLYFLSTPVPPSVVSTAPDRRLYACMHVHIIALHNSCEMCISKIQISGARRSTGGRVIRRLGYLSILVRACDG